ncbi:MAG: TIGR03915 family putative DNA repair protein, partial [Gemmatimonadetes bacterium]|nr:TIGR03915 family putative DNA repair protein [Gemmatimonadota bacterium]
MQRVEEITFDGRWAGWRVAARDALCRGLGPDLIEWRDPWSQQTSLFARPVAADPRTSLPTDHAISTHQPGDPRGDQPRGRRGGQPRGHRRDQPRVPKAFMQVGPSVACHRDPRRWSALYEVLWRLTRGEPEILDIASEPVVAELRAMDRSVRRDVHKMRAFLRFRSVGEIDGAERWLAWFEPEHRILERNERFFVERFTSMNFSIFTPDASLHWDGERTVFGPGCEAHEARGSDSLDGLWRSYYASTYNPARTRWRAMVSEMPVKYWKNLPEAALIPDLVRGSESAVQEMLDAGPVADPSVLRERKRRAAKRRDTGE